MKFSMHNAISTLHTQKKKTSPLFKILTKKIHIVT